METNLTIRGTVTAVCVSGEKGVSKTPVAAARLVADWGIAGDAHAGPGNRQVSLLGEASIEKMREKTSSSTEEVVLSPGAFAENLTLDAAFPAGAISVGTRIRLQRGPVLEITQIGKECHTGCAIRRAVGDCVMPREGLFARVVAGGEVRPGDQWMIE